MSERLNDLEDRSKKALDFIAKNLREGGVSSEFAQDGLYDQCGILKFCEDRLASNCMYCLPVILPQVLYLLENGYQYNKGKPLPSGISAWSREVTIGFLSEIGFDDDHVEELVQAIKRPGWLSDAK